MKLEVENALPAAEQAKASGQPEVSAETKALNAAIDGEAGANTEESAKREKTPEERRIANLERSLSRALRQRAELRAELGMRGGQMPSRQADGGDRNTEATSDDEPLTLSRSELRKLIEKEAKTLAPSIRQQEDEVEHRRGIVEKLSGEWGSEKFDAYARDLDAALDGLTDKSGRPKPAADAIFEADNPRALIEYLTDPENADQAEAIGRMSAVKAAMAIAKIESKLRAETEARKAKPKPSSAPAPIESVKATGAPPAMSLVGLSDADFAKRRRQQIAARR